MYKIEVNGKEEELGVELRAGYESDTDFFLTYRGHIVSPSLRQGVDVNKWLDKDVVSNVSSIIKLEKAEVDVKHVTGMNKDVKILLDEISESMSSSFNGYLARTHRDVKLFLNEEVIDGMLELIKINIKNNIERPLSKHFTKVRLQPDIEPLNDDEDMLDNVHMSDDFQPPSHYPTHTDDFPDCDPDPYDGCPKPSDDEIYRLEQEDKKWGPEWKLAPGCSF